MLITNVADLHALDLENRTPFTYLLQAMHLNYGYWCDYYLCDAVKRWDQCIQDAGKSLQTYVVAENCLQSKFGTAASNLQIGPHGDSKTCRLVILETSTLGIEIEFFSQRALWQ
jgi:hypothetical protein